MDGGDLLFRSPQLAGGPGNRVLRDQALLIARTYARTEVAAVNVGRNDLAGGLPFLLELSRATALPWVSTNLRSIDGSYPLPRHRLLAWGATRIAVVGVLAEDPARDRELGIVVEPASDAVRSVLSDLRGVDAVICLSALSPEGERKLALEVPAARIVVGVGGQVYPHPAVAGETVILHAGDRGRYVGTFDVAENALQRWSRPRNSEDVQALENRLMGIRAQIDGSKKNSQQATGQSQAGVSDPAALARQAEVVERQVAEIRNSPALFSNRITGIDASAGEDPEIASWVRDHKKAAEEKHGRVFAPAGPPAARMGLPPGALRPSDRRVPAFTGSAACRSCHAQSYEAWTATPHARAFAAISGKGQDIGPCLECHTTGLMRLAGSPFEPAVGCETCHGPGGNHRAKSNIARAPSEATCRGCHRGFHPGNPFDYASGLARVRCDQRQKPPEDHRSAPDPLLDPGTGPAVPGNDSGCTDESHGTAD